MDEKEKKELASGLKAKRRRKYILIALAAFIGVSAIVGLSIESKDAKLPDGQGNIVVGQPAEAEDEETSETENTYEDSVDGEDDDFELIPRDNDKSDSEEVDGLDKKILDEY